MVLPAVVVICHLLVVFVVSLRTMEALGSSKLKAPTSVLYRIAFVSTPLSIVPIIKLSSFSVYLIKALLVFAFKVVMSLEISVRNSPPVITSSIACSSKSMLSSLKSIAKSVKIRSARSVLIFV